MCAECFVSEHLIIALNLYEECQFSCVGEPDGQTLQGIRGARGQE